eukprot:1395391-Amorphochlora_amoeboformis.AAC.2
MGSVRFGRDFGFRITLGHPRDKSTTDLHFPAKLPEFLEIYGDHLYQSQTRDFRVKSRKHDAGPLGCGGYRNIDKIGMDTDSFSLYLSLNVLKISTRDIRRRKSEGEGV